MKLILHIVCVFFLLPAFGQQEWRDSLDVAREAYKNKEYPKALKYYESAQKKAPENVDLSDEMAQSAYKAREFEKAEKIYQQNSGAKKTSTEQADNYHNIGNSRLKRKDYEGAIDSYKESLRHNPNDDKTRYNLSEAIRQLKNQQKKNGGGGGGGNGNSNPGGNDGDNDGDEESDPKDGSGGSGQPRDSNDKKNKSSLPNKAVESMLDKIMKEEAETKKKMRSSKGKNKSSKSGKDW
jgi:Ca-activated chloride channel homolog